MSRPVGGILSSLPTQREAEGLGGHPSERPTWGVPLLRGRTSNPSPTLGLAPGGVYRAGGVTPVAGALLPHPFTFACAGRSPPSAVSFLWHCPASRPDWPLASTLLCGVPTFLDAAPLSRPAPRPPGRLTVPSILSVHRHRACTWTGRMRQNSTLPRFRLEPASRRASSGGFPFDSRAQGKHDHTALRRRPAAEGKRPCA